MRNYRHTNRLHLLVTTDRQATFVNGLGSTPIVKPSERNFVMYVPGLDICGIYIMLVLDSIKLFMCVWLYLSRARSMHTIMNCTERNSATKLSRWTAANTRNPFYLQMKCQKGRRSI